MRYFCTNPSVFSVLFALSFLTLALSLHTTQVELMKKIYHSTAQNYIWSPNSDPCRWQGVNCSENGGHDVVELKLSDCWIKLDIWQYVCKLPALQVLGLFNNTFHSGVFPLELTGCKNLTSVEFQNNHQRGPIRESVGSFANLETVSLRSNNFSGSIPLQLCSLSNLQTLDLGGNRLTGIIPSQLCSLSNLQVLDLSFNQLRGSIPSKVFSLSNLKELDLTSNLLSGAIPQNFSKNLSILKTSNNKLIGTIPSTVSNAPNLTHLVANNNFLNGSIPEQLAICTQQSLTLCKLRNLEILDFSNNRLTGEIPESLGNLWYLSVLNLQNNKLTRKIPESLGNLWGLSVLNLQNNKLTGKIPESLGNLWGLSVLNLQNNKLSGRIPKSLGNLSELSVLNLQNNKLTGKIPESLGNLWELSVLDLSNNNLTGKIPESLGILQGLSVLNLSNNKLTGKISDSLKYIRILDLSNNEMGKSQSTSVKKILGVVGAVAAAFIICCLFLGVLWIRKLHNRPRFKQEISKILQKVEHPRISYEELLAATNRFHNSNLLATNSFGSVYKGFLPDGTHVAVKVLNLMHEQSDKIFKAECKVLQKARHRNLARIITTCSTIHFKALIFEYFSNGSLEKHLYLGSCRLGLRKLLSIAIDIAHALEYLHYDCFVQIVHCDIKPSNVLLDESMTAHLSDFGISRLMGRITANSVTSTIDLKGSVGYIAPEYGLSGMTSPRGDVYSYGILLLEMLTRRQPTDSMFDGDLNLHNWVKRAFPDRAFEVVDKSLLMEGAGKETEECIISLMRLGLLCSSDSPETRPTMRDGPIY